MSAFGGAVRSEYLKVATVRLWWILAIILLVYVALLSGGISIGVNVAGSDSGDAGAAGGAGAFPFGPELVYSLASSIGYVFPVLFAALATTQEFKQQTLTPTFLATPRRTVALGAKVLVLTVVGALYGVVALIASVGAGAAVLSAGGQDTLLAETDTWALIGRTVLAMALWATIGAGLGVLVPSQVAAIVIVLAFTQFVEPILRLGSQAFEWAAPVGRFLPGAASDALVGASVFTVMSADADPFVWWQGGAVLLAYAVVATVGGYFTSWRRDVT